jgi:hypothetical protein
VTRERDLVLVNIRNKPAFFARIEDISADVKPGWYQVKMLVLQVPLLVITWILREAYINGEEFTMGGHPVTLAKVISPEATTAGTLPFAETALDAQADNEVGDPREAARPADPQHVQPEGKVVSLLDRRKKGDRTGR